MTTYVDLHPSSGGELAAVIRDYAGHTYPFAVLAIKTEDTEVALHFASLAALREFVARIAATTPTFTPKPAQP